jgi:putative nucleotidyltransferase with HDIG domain
MVTRYQFVTRRSLRTSGVILPGRPARVVRVDVAGERRWLAGSVPCELAWSLLGSLAGRWAHTRAAGAQAELAAVTVPAGDRDLVIAAAWLHDIGYAADLNDTGFHPLDGARYLRRIGAPMRLAALVAHHSEAVLLAEARGLLDQLEEFPREHLLVSDVVAYADMTAGPTGQLMTVSDRLADIRARHAGEGPDLYAARLGREPLLTAAAARVHRRLHAAA